MHKLVNKAGQTCKYKIKIAVTEL